MVDQSSPFLGLPAELRNTIYNFTFEDDRQRCLNEFYRAPGLLGANRQVRHEAADIYYACTEFYFVKPEDAVKWLTHLEHSHIRLLREVRCTLLHGPVSAQSTLDSVWEYLGRATMALPGKSLKIRFTFHGKLAPWTSAPWNAWKEAISKGAIKE